jgi:hypothetical protein
MCRATIASGHGGHADRVGADRAQIPHLCRRLVGRPVPGDVDAVRQFQTHRRACFVGDPAQPRRIDVRQVRKSYSEPVVVRANQRVAAEEVDMIVDHHQISG